MDETNLSEEFASQAAVYGWITKLTADAEYEASLAKHEREVAYASAAEYWRDQLAEGSKRVTEAMVEHAVTLDEDYIQAKEKELRTAHEFNLLKNISYALKMKADMLISMGAHIRAEREMTGMTINTLDEEITKFKKRAAS